MARIDPNKLTLEERVVQINRVAKVVKGGRRFSFSAVVVVGDGNGHVGVGLGKAGEVPESIRKGVEDAKKNIIRVPMVGTTIPHEVRTEYAAARVMLKPASQGTGVIAGGAVRAVVEAAGIHDILAKVHGSTNPVNVTRATINALASLHSAAEIILVVPIVMPLVKAVGIDPVHFGLIVTINLGIGQQTPPVASVLMTACAIAKADMWEVTKVNIYFIAVLMATLLMVTYVPISGMGLVELFYR